jgi:hypothetical protein
MAEVRGDWLPATLRHLDEVFDRSRADLPATRRPSQYWRENCLVALSFVHKAEVEIRDEIGIDTITFARDYPHAEGTWPNTSAWLRDAFGELSEDQLRPVLGENAIRVLRLDRAKLAAVADRIGPTAEDITGPGHDIDPRLVAIWDTRSGYLKPREQFDVEEITPLLEEDIVAAAQH